MSVRPRHKSHYEPPESAALGTELWQTGLADPVRGQEDTSGQSYQEHAMQIQVVGAPARAQKVPDCTGQSRTDS
jgi:hypothetical protein